MPAKVLEIRKNEDKLPKGLFSGQIFLLQVLQSNKTCWKFTLAVVFY